MPRINRRGRYILGLLVGVIALLTVAGWLVNLYTEYLWYDSTGYSGVFSTQIWTKIAMFAAFGAIMALWTAANLYVAWRFRPDSVPHTPEQQSMERYRSALDPKIGWWIAGVAALIGVFAGVSAQDRWQQWLLFSNSQEFGRVDPIFEVDAGFYVFELPFWEYLIGVGFTMIVIGILAALGTHYLYGAVRMSGRGERITAAARWHLSILIGLFVLMKAVAYYFDRYALTLEQSQVTNPSITGGGYTAITALLGAKEILIFVSVLAAIAVVLFSNFWVRSLLGPGMALGLVLISAIAIGGIYPFAVQQLEVAPNAPQKEADYVAYTIDGTMFAYDMGDMQRTDLSVDGTPDASILATDTGTVPYTRLLDPSIVSDAFTQKQQARGFHDFNDKLDVDRYVNADGEVQDYVVGVRELNPAQLANQDWTVRHTIYTHGYGLVAAPTNRVCDSGPYFESGSLLELQESDEAAVEDGEDPVQDNDTSSTCRSTTDFVEITHPQIYFGELNDDYAIVGIPDGESPREYDRPSGGTTTEDSAETGDEEVDAQGDAYVTYEGDGGVDVSSLWHRLWYAWEFGETNFLLSDRFNENSKLLYHRTPRERVERVAPFLTVDGDPYPTVVDGRVLWVLDGYTTSNSFPYSNSVNLQDATMDSHTGQGATQQDSQAINYMRNSVKATVDAYDGTVTLYEFGEPDPMLEAWNAAFGDIVKPESEIPEELMQHLRYPVDQFKVQRTLLERFHIDNARVFIDGSEVWETPGDPRVEGAKLPPYYVLATFPGQEDPQYQLTSNFSPRDRGNVLSAIMTGRYDENNRPVLTLYGLPSGQVESTSQKHQDMTSTPEVAADLKLFEQQGTTVQWGNLLSLPVGNGIMYVEPMYLQRQGSNEGVALPLLRRVLVSYGDYIGYEESFGDAIESVVAQYTGDDNAAPPPDEEPDEGEEPEEPAEGEVPADVQAALDAIDQAIADLKKAMEDGDLAAQGEALADLDAALKAYDEAKG